MVQMLIYKVPPWLIPVLALPLFVLVACVCKIPLQQSRGQKNITVRFLVFACPKFSRTSHWVCP